MHHIRRILPVRLLSLALPALVVLLPVLPAHAASPGIKHSAKVVVKSIYGDERTNVALEEYGQVGGPFMVPARAYAQWIGAGYHWYPDTRQFTLDKVLSLDGQAQIRVKVTFQLDSYAAYVSEGDSVQLYDLAKAVGARPYERDGDTANMAPLRFLNDVFDIYSEWLPGYNVWYSYLDTTRYGAQPPLWDRQKIKQYDVVFGQEVIRPDNGWPLLPSTVRRLQETVPYFYNLQDVTERYNIPYNRDLVQLRFQYLDYWGGKPLLDLSPDHGRLKVTAWYHTYDMAAQQLAQLKDTHSLWKTVDGGTTVLTLGASGVAALVGAPELGALALVTAASGGMYLGADRYYSVSETDLETCINRANQYHSDHNTDHFSMGIFSDGSVATCITHYTGS